MEKDSFIILQRVKGLQDLAANERNWNYLNWPSAHGVSFVCDLKILLHLSLKVLLICFFYGFSEKKKTFFIGEGGGGRLGKDIRLPVDILSLINSNKRFSKVEDEINSLRG